LKKSKKDKASSPVANVDTLRLVNELQVHQIELEMQNEDLELTRAATEAVFQQYTDLYDFAPVGYFTLANDGAIRQVNLSGTNLLGLDRSKLIKRRFGLFVSPQFRPTFTAFLEKVFLTGAEKETCVVELLKDKTETLWAHIEAVCDNSRETCRAVVVDISARKQTEENLRRAIERLALAQRAAGAGMWDWDMTSGKLNWSPEFFLLFGLDPAKTQATFDTWCGVLHPDDVQLAEQHITESVRDHIQLFNEYRIVMPSGETRWIGAWGDTTYNERGEALRMPGICIDISERKRAEEEMRQLNASLEQRVEERTRELRDAQDKFVRHEKLSAIGQMAGSISHELRNPLSVISNAVYFLKISQPDASDKIKEYLNLIEKHTNISTKIVTDLLDFASSESVQRQSVSVSDLIRQTLEHFPAPDSVQVTLDLPADVLQTYADPQHVIQVLGNLILNACQAMDSSAGMILTSSTENISKGGQLTITSRAHDNMINIVVQDSGAGISAENMKKLFDPLFTTKPKGIGLGLAVSKKLIEANGGRIEVQSEVGVGSTFTVWLPIQKKIMPILELRHKL
jgi:PAS domain S-box-containing protein